MTDRAPLLGDPLPPVVDRCYRSFDGNDLDAVVACCTDDVLCAVPVAGVIETAPRRVCDGLPAVRAWFDERGPRPRRHDPTMCVVNGNDVLLEGQVIDTGSGDPISTFLASIQLRTDGSGEQRISRYLAYACDGLVDPYAGTIDWSADADASAVIDHYFHELETGAFEAAADCFSPETVYSHPPYRHTGIEEPGRITFRGRPALLGGFRARGKTSFRHRTVAEGQRGRCYLFEGIVVDLPNGGSGSFISSAVLDDDARIARYVSCYCEPAVARR